MFWTLAIPFLKDLIERVIPDPQQRLEAQRQLAEFELKAREAEARAEAARAEEFARFIEATQPSHDRVYAWANTLIALVRPALALFTCVTLIAYTQKWLEILSALRDAGVWGAIGISPLLVWILGRDGLRMVLGVVSMRTGQAIPPDTLPSGVLPPAEKNGRAGGARQPFLREEDWPRSPVQLDPAGHFGAGADRW